MTDAENLKSISRYLQSLQASIEMLEIKADFLESILPELDPELAERYQYFVHDRTLELKANPKSAIGILFADREQNE